MTEIGAINLCGDPDFLKRVAFSLAKNAKVIHAETAGPRTALASRIAAAPDTYAKGFAYVALASLSAASYRAVGQEEEAQQLQVWSALLALGQPLATLPLWIASDFSVPLDLEASYQMTCADLRIHQAPVRLLPTTDSD